MALPLFWSHDRLQDTPDTIFDLRDRGLLLGDGVFDTALVIGGVVIDRDAHQKRLIVHAARIGIEITADFMAPALAALSDGQTGLLRLTVTRGVGLRGLAPPEPAQPVLYGQISVWDPAVCFAPVRLWETPIRRNATSPAARIKSLNYLDNVLAQRDALKAGADDALFLNHQGRICCAGAGNLFVMVDGGIVTPPLEDGVMDGTLRGWMLAQNISIHEQSFGIDVLARAEGVLMTNSRRLVAPVTQLLRPNAAPITFSGTVPDEIRRRLMAHLCAQAPAAVDYFTPHLWL